MLMLVNPEAIRHWGNVFLHHYTVVSKNYKKTIKQLEALPFVVTAKHSLVESLVKWLFKDAFQLVVTLPLAYSG